MNNIVKKNISYLTLLYYLFNKKINIESYIIIKLY